MSTEYIEPEALHQLRIDLGLTQQQAASLIGYSVRAWQEWEAGRCRMRPIIFEKFKQEALCLPSSSVPPQDAA